jgi:hypothetical protein
MDTPPPLPPGLLAVPVGAAALLGVGAGAAAVGGFPPVLLMSACALVTGRPAGPGGSLPRRRSR